MFFEQLSNIPRLVKSTHTTIFAIDPETPLDLPHAIDIRPPENKNDITIEQIREIIALSNSKQLKEQFIIIRYAEKLSQNAANALLKLLEEPKNNYHFALLATEPSALLPTILSRAFLFLPRIEHPLEQKPTADAKILDFAKRMLTATPSQLPGLADEIGKIKDHQREQAIAITATAIELAYKSYFATKKPSFLAKIPKLLLLYQNLQSNGLLKLHIVADLC